MNKELLFDKLYGRTYDAAGGSAGPKYRLVNSARSGRKQR